MRISAGYLSVALALQEAAEDLSASDICARLRDAINDEHRGTGEWAYYIDHYGDGESGEVIYSCGGDTRRAAYTMSSANGTAATCDIDFDNSENVVPRTVYEPEADEADHYAAMEESLKREGLYTALPLYERFISKSERENMDSEDFAGKGKSFPIAKPSDIMAAVRSIGRAGGKNLSPSGIKARIIAIAKRKGWEKYLPKAWRTDTDSTESAAVVSATSAAGSLRLNESAATLEPIVLREARADYEIKLIAPGKGSSAFYPAEVLKRDGPKVFGAGTHVYLNHPTAAEESARPEGDVANLAGVLTTGAVYHESHPKGEGLYARMKVFADHAQMVEEKAAHVGMSIRAAGNAVMEAGRMKMRDGVPILASLDEATSVDVVTRAGAGGMILTEAARTAATNEVNMTKEEIQELVSAAVREALSTRDAAVSLQSRAMDEATRLLESVSLPREAKAVIVARVTAGTLPVKDGALDVAAFRSVVEAEAVREGEYVASLTGSGRVTGLGASAGVTQISEADREKAEKRARKEAKRLQESAASIFTSIGMPEDAARIAANGRVA